MRAPTRITTPPIPPNAPAIAGVVVSTACAAFLAINARSTLGAALGVGEGVGVIVGVTLDVMEGVGVTDEEILGVMEGVGVGVRLIEILGVGDFEGV